MTYLLHRILQNAHLNNYKKGNFMKEKLQKFMMGRYGVDDFSKFILYVMFALCIISLFIRHSIFNLLLLAGLIFLYFRMFSKNIEKRYQENLWFLRKKDSFIHLFQKEKNILAQKKTFHIYTCPGCKQKIRIPKGKGKLLITCPKCHKEFTKRT